MGTISKFILLGVLLTLLSTCLPTEVYSPDGARATPRGFPIAFFTQDNGQYNPSAWPVRYGLNRWQENPVSNFSARSFLFNSIFWISISLVLAYVIAIFRTSNAVNSPLPDAATKSANHETKPLSIWFAVSRRKQVTVLGLFYFLPVFLLSMANFESDLRRFDCPTPAEPHFGMSTGSYKNPNPSICYRRAFEISRIPGRLVLFFFTAPFFVLHLIINSRIQSSIHAKKASVQKTKPPNDSGFNWRLITSGLVLPACALLLAILYVSFIVFIEKSIGLRHGCYWMGFCELLFLCFTLGTMICVTVTIQMGHAVKGISDILRKHSAQCVVLYLASVFFLAQLPQTSGKAYSATSALLTLSASPIVINLATLIIACVLTHSRPKVF